MKRVAITVKYSFVIEIASYCITLEEHGKVSKDDFWRFGVVSN